MKTKAESVSLRSQIKRAWSDAQLTVTVNRPGLESIYM